ncbi:hypothetical protein VMCG_10421 [Cytospora schulzeri]|uniref:Uncharacterized protein n=1 Tax=Cytospora schulzeri TaxID=448051 RepID=A0A423VB29_9PEZI|nr:hypothetical protein VMCG_10421 [Valsa malicola]
MASRTSHTWSFPGVEYIWPGDSTAQRNPLPRTGSNSNSASSTTTSLSSVTTSSYDNSNSNSNSNSTSTNNNRSTSHRPTRHVTFDNASELSDVSASSTKASSGSSIPSSTTTTPSHHGPSLRASRMTKSDARPSGNPAAGPARPTYGPEQQQYAPQQPSHSASQSYHRPPLVSTGSSQQSIFGNPHGIRDRHTLVAQTKPPVVVPNSSSSNSNNSSSRSGAPSNVRNPFTSTTPSLNHLGIPGYVGATPSQPPMPIPLQIQMPGAFPTETVIPYRRPTDVSTQLSMSTNDSADHFPNDDVWDSEGDSGSCLSTSTDATTVASDITEKGGEGYGMAHTHRAPSSSGTVTPTQSSQQNRHAQMFSGSSHRTPRGPILRRAGHKSVLSTGSKTPSLSSVSSVRSSSTQHSAKTSSASTGSNPSTTGTRSSHGRGGGPRIHIEVNRSVQSRESQTDLRKRKMIEEALIDKIEQLKDQGQVRDTSPPSSIASVPSRQGLSVRFAEPEREKEKPRSPVSVAPQQVKPKAPVVPTAPEEAKPQPLAPAPVPTSVSAPTTADPTPAPAPAPALVPAPTVSEQEKNLSKELVLQTREIQKLELELEKRDVLIREKEKLEQELKLKEESAALERKTEHEQHLKQLQRERTEAEKAEKERQRTVQKEVERLDREKKEVEKAEKERDKQLQKQREQLEREKQEVERAQKEHDKLQASFIEQGNLLSDLKNRFDEQSKTLETTEAERAELQETRDDFERKCSDLSRTLSHVSDKERFVVEQVASLQIIKEALQGRVGPLETRVEEQKKEIDGLNKERDGLYQDVKSYLLNITELETQVKSLVEEKRGFITQVGELEKAKCDLQAEVKDRDGQIATLTENIEARAQEMQEHIASLKGEHSKEIEELQAARQAQLDGLKEEHTVLVSELEEQIAGLHEHVDGAHLDIDNLKNNITSLEGNLVEERTKSDTLSTERDRILADLEAHKSLAVTQETNVLSLHADIAARDEELASIKETNKSLQAEHEELQQLADSLDDRKTQEQSSFKDLQAKNAELETQVTSTKAELEERIKALEGERDTAASALVVAQVELSNAKAAAEKIPVLEEEAGKVPALASEKAELEGKVADLESHASQVPSLRAHCDKLAEQLSAANKLIEGLTAAAHAGLNTSSTPASPMMTPLSPKLPQDIPVPESPKLAPQRKVRSRAPSMVRSISSRSSASTRRDKGPKDDMALVIVRDTKDRGSVTVVRKCDLKSPRSRSQPPVKE